jgi:hypothetical protein
MVSMFGCAECCVGAIIVIIWKDEVRLEYSESKQRIQGVTRGRM